MYPIRFTSAKESLLEIVFSNFVYVFEILECSCWC